MSKISDTGIEEQQRAAVEQTPEDDNDDSGEDLGWIHVPHKVVSTPPAVEQAEPEQRMHNCWWVDEVERLREVLEKIKEKMSPNISPEKFIHEIARAALGTQEPNK